MVFPESNVPIEERYLIVFGKASQEVIELVKDDLPDVFSENTGIVFIDFAVADYPVGTIFTKVFRKEDVSICENANCRIVGVTQQFAKPVSEISHGWKTICAVEFTPSIPSLIQDLPEIDDWYDERKDRICLSSEQTWQTLASKN